jgi:repressor of nif and glnA expression
VNVEREVEVTLTEPKSNRHALSVPEITQRIEQRTGQQVGAHEVREVVSELAELGFVERVGSGRGTKYAANELTNEK